MTNPVALLAAGVVAFYGLRSVYICAALAWCWRHYRVHAAACEQDPAAEAATLDVLVPAFAEQAVMPASIRHYAALARQWAGLRVWIVTAAREQARCIPGARTTDAVCRELAAAANESLGRRAFDVLCYPGGTGRRASQLNFGVDSLTAADGYVAIFDADARPDVRLGAQFTKAAATQPAMIQQLQLPAFEAAAVRHRSAVMSGQDLYALRRVLGIEYRRILISRWCRRRKPMLLCAAMRPMVYGVGSGLIVHRASLAEIGRFQEPHDDLAVGHRLSMAGAEIAVLPSVNIVEPYRDIASMARAFSSVAFGNAAAARDYRHARGHPSALGPVEQRLMLWRAQADGVLWAVGPYLVLAALIASLVRGGPERLAAVGALAVNGLMEPVAAHHYRRQVLRTVGQPVTGSRGAFHQAPLPWSLCCYLLQPALTSMGPWLLGIRWVAASVRGRPIAFTKTAHLGVPQEGHDG
jgi:hypothetical protein